MTTEAADITETTITLKAADGFAFEAFRCTPKQGIKGGLVVLQEIFGLTDQLKSVVRAYARDGYDADWIRALAADRGAWANIPPRCNRKEPICFSPYLYRARNLVERFFNKIKHCRRVATRYDKLAANYLAFIHLASIRLWLRVNEFTS